MGRKNKKYAKSLHQQAYERLTGMLAIGESKKTAMAADEAGGKIFSFNTYKTYAEHVRYFTRWVMQKHPECKTLKSAKKYVNDFLQARTDQVDAEGRHLSAWTIQTEAAALNKLYQIDKADPGRFQPPVRKRGEIRRSRLPAARDRHFSTTNNDELIRFCRGTGCRRNVLQRLTGDDFWTREKMEMKISALEKRQSGKASTPTIRELRLLTILQEALQVFPDQDCFLFHRGDKGGRNRFAPIIGPDKEQIAARMRSTAPGKKVWEHVSSNADIHGYRADYATAMYRMYARDIDDIPYDRINQGSGRAYQGDVYCCRNDDHGRKLDKAAMIKCSKALGHNRISVVASSYLRGL